MARKKTVTISRKPTGDAFPHEISAAVRSGGKAVMPETPESHAATPRDPLNPPSLPAAGPIGRILYGTAFGLAYGVVFSAVLVGKLIPGSDSIGRGFRDGGAAARRYFEAEPDSKVRDTSICSPIGGSVPCNTSAA